MTGYSGLPVSQNGASGWRKREERDGGQLLLSSRSRVLLRHDSPALLSCQPSTTPLLTGECAEPRGPSPRLHLGRVDLQAPGQESTLMPALTHTTGCTFVP